MWNKKRACPGCGNYIAACTCKKNEDLIGTILTTGASFDWISPTLDIIEDVAAKLGRIGKVETTTDGKKQ